MMVVLELLLLNNRSFLLKSSVREADPSIIFVRRMCVYLKCPQNVTFPQQKASLQNGLLVFFGKITFLKTSWKPSMFSTIFLAATTTNLEIVEKLACEAKYLGNFLRFRVFHSFHLSCFQCFCFFFFLAFLFCAMFQISGMESQQARSNMLAKNTKGQNCELTHDENVRAQPC